MIAMREAGYYKVGLLTRGSCRLTQDGREALLHPGDLAIYDCRRPYTMAFGEPHQMSFLMFPCDRLRLPPAAVDQVLVTPVFSSESTGSLVAPFLRQLVANLDQPKSPVNCRLDNCRRDLEDPALAQRGVQAIGRRWGLVDAAHFTRIFKASFGEPPGTGITQALVTLFLLVSMAALWNLLAGYAGMISFGQQAYLGIGAYIVWLVSKTGVSPFAGIAAGAAFCAVATWVVAECLFLYVTNQLWLGGATGVSLSGQLSGMPPVVRQAYTYWLGLALMVAVVAGVYLLVRSRFGLDSRAVHDEPAAAAAMGVEVQRTRWLAYVLAAVGFGAVGGMLIISTLYIDPATVFSVTYGADMLFMVVIGGLGTMEGPIIGAVIFFAIQERFSAYGAWYLVAIGVVAIVVVLTAPGGLWGIAAGRGWSLLPVGYRVRGVSLPGPGGPAGPGEPASAPYGPAAGPDEPADAPDESARAPAGGDGNG